MKDLIELFYSIKESTTHLVLRGLFGVRTHGFVYARQVLCHGVPSLASLVPFETDSYVGLNLN